MFASIFIKIGLFNFQDNFRFSKQLIDIRDNLCAGFFVILIGEVNLIAGRRFYCNFKTHLDVFFHGFRYCSDPFFFRQNLLGNSN